MKPSSKYSYWRLFRHWPPANSFLQLAMSKNDINHLFLVTGHIKSWGDIVCRFHQNKPSIRSILFRRTLLLEVAPSCMLCFIGNCIISSRLMVIRISIWFANYDKVLEKYMEKATLFKFLFQSKNEISRHLRIRLNFLINEKSSLLLHWPFWSNFFALILAYSGRFYFLMWPCHHELP